MYGYIYKTTNKLNGKIYIGQKKADKFLGTNYLGSGKYLKRAIAKYGKQNFCVEFIDSAETRQELSDLEIYYIALFGATNINIGYNIARGGIGGGEVYVHNNDKNEFISRDCLDDYLSRGWQLGMLPGRKEKNHSATRAFSISKALKGKIKSKTHIENHTNSLKNAHRHWYTNGLVEGNLLLGDGDEIPEGYYRGRTIPEEIKSKSGLANIGRVPWNKGLTKYTDSRVAEYSRKLKK